MQKERLPEKGSLSFCGHATPTGSGKYSKALIVQETCDPDGIAPALLSAPVHDVGKNYTNALRNMRC